MISLIVAIAYYGSTALVDLIRNVTGWLPDTINEGRLDKVYWTLCVIGSLNFGYYLVCSWLYRYINIEEEMARSVNEDNEETRQEG
ncbi:hypothetical protein SLE2022_284730 [Rubroshorea leprosula]